ncbi:BafA family autotransporter [Bartonella sp. B10]
MQYKCKLSFSVLMISSCLVNIVSAEESASVLLNRMIVNDRIVLKDHALIVNLLSNKTTIEEGGVEIVENRGTSNDAVVNLHGKQIVTRGGTAINTKMYGGKQIIFEEESFGSLVNSKSSSAYHAVVYGKNGTAGQQNVYDGGHAWHTTVMDGGEQNLYRGHRTEGGSATYTTVLKDGRQHVLDGGKAKDVTLQDDAVQVVYPGGYVENLTINNRAHAWVHVGAQLEGETKVNEKGHLHFYFGDATNHITRENLTVEGRSDEELFLVGMRNGKDNPQINVKNLSGSGGTVSFSSISYDPHHSLLHVENLSGNLHFHFNISTQEKRGDYMVIGTGGGNHTISVVDSGIEITNLLAREHDFVTELNLITDRSENGGANFTLTDYSGRAVTTVDGGTYMYSLQKRAKSDNQTIWYLGAETGKRKPLESNRRRVIKKPHVSLSNRGHGKLQRPKSSLRRLNRGSAGVDLSTILSTDEGMVKPPAKSRPPRHLSANSPVLMSSTVVSPKGESVDSSDLMSSNQRSGRRRQPPISSSVASSANNVVEVSSPRDSHRSLNGNHQSATSSSSPSLDNQIVDDSNHQDDLSPQLMQELLTSDLLTTPSTDAVLSMAVTPELIFNSELQSIRIGKGILDRNKRNSTLWTYAIKNKEQLSTGHTDFKLNQTGLVLGMNALNSLVNGELYIGGFGSYNRAHIAHSRGGTSDITSYSIGTYATYFNHSGWYLDGVLKYNHYQNNLQAVSTNGLSIQGDYDRWAIGTSFEVGYRCKVSQSSWMQPYAQLSWLQVKGKEVKLSNGMMGDISPSTSLRSEVGLSLGYEFGSGMDTPSLAYVTAAWLRENIEHNHTTINQQHKFTTDLSGNSGKLGVGLSSSVSDKLQLYAEAHYLKGHKTKQSLQGILGLRYSF